MILVGPFRLGIFHDSIIVVQEGYSTASLKQSTSETGSPNSEISQPQPRGVARREMRAIPSQSLESNGQQNKLILVGLAGEE